MKGLINMNDKKKNARAIAFGYILGSIFTALIIILLLAVAAKMEILSLRYARIPATAGIPDDILEELKKTRAVIGHANNPTGAGKHYTNFTRDDAELGSVLNPNAKVEAYAFKSPAPLENFPVLYIIPGEKLSPKVQDFIKKESLQYFSYSTDSEGHRRTVPEVQSEKKILIVGDSVTFGVGCNDEYTIASFLHNKLGNEYKVVNAGVGGYNAEQVLKVTELQAEKNKYAGLIYVACQNDFGEGVLTASKLLDRIARTAPSYNNRIVILLHTYLDYQMRYFLLDSANGWSKRLSECTDELRKGFSAKCDSLYFEFVDWTDIVNDYKSREKSLYAPFALYTDHCHLSPTGNRFVADKLFDIVKNKW